MSYVLKVEIASIAPDQIVEIPGLGACVNNNSVEISDELAANFQVVHGYSLEDSNFQTGITLLDATGNPLTKGISNFDPRESETPNTDQERTQEPSTDQEDTVATEEGEN